MKWQGTIVEQPTFDGVTLPMVRAKLTDDNYPCPVFAEFLLDEIPLHYRSKAVVGNLLSWEVTKEVSRVRITEP